MRDDGLLQMAALRLVIIEGRRSMKTDEQKRLHRVCALNAVLKQNCVASQYEWDTDHEGNAAYCIGHWMGKENCLLLWLRARPRSGKQFRKMGEIIDEIGRAHV